RINMSNNTYKIENAKTGRSSCKGRSCKSTIEKGAMRIGKIYPSARFEDDGVATDYFHPQCLFDSQLRARKSTKKVESLEDLDGFDDLSSQDQKEIKKMLNGEYDTFLGTKRNHNHLPANDQVFTAFNSIPSPKDVRVVVLGQQPMAKKEHASGFAYCDRAAVSWNLDKCKVSTRNLIKSAMISKEYISKIDDLETIQEVLKEVDLPGDSPRDWFKATASQGVLWLNTSLTVTEDREDDRKPHETIWTPFIEEALRVIFNAKINESEGDISGIVFVMFGKHFAGVKPIIEKVHAEVMGVVPIEYVEGGSPVLEAFHNVNYFATINQMLEKVGSAKVDWFPSSPAKDDYEDEDDEEEEDEQHHHGSTSTSTTTSTSKTSNNGNSTFTSKYKLDFLEDDEDTPNAEPVDMDAVQQADIDMTGPLAKLVQEDGTVIELKDGEDVTLGRQSLQIRDLLVSRKQASIVANKKNGKVVVELTPLGTNQMHISKQDEENVPLAPFIVHTLQHGDVFLLCSLKYPFRVEIPSAAVQSPKTVAAATSKPKPKVQAPKKEPEESKFDFLDVRGGSDGEAEAKPTKKKAATPAKKEKEEDDNEKVTNKKRKATQQDRPKRKRTTKKKDDDFVVDTGYSDDDIIEEDNSDEDWKPSGGEEDDDDDYDLPQTRSSAKPDCMYWDKCYRTNSDHLRDYRHPTSK
ncbi:hypothetical protein SAMD00019534_088030, partial [Acytostelium subglobosum LB1]|uniref:hypothetical protein n=1 Tax=Acytostelium subglobosum LB1 TaxID=1410327 RepID=UPI0006451849